MDGWHRRRLAREPVFHLAGSNRAAQARRYNRAGAGRLVRRRGAFGASLSENERQGWSEADRRRRPVPECP
jgi:hypothetical protein